MNTVCYKKTAMMSVLALEGLEDYGKPGNVDIREVKPMGIAFIYHAQIKAWAQI